MSKNASCPVCLIEHDEEIHEATLNVRQWFRGEVTKHFADYLVEEPEEALEVTAA